MSSPTQLLPRVMKFSWPQKNPPDPCFVGLFSRKSWANIFCFLRMEICKCHFLLISITLNVERGKKIERRFGKMWIVEGFFALTAPGGHWTWKKFSTKRHKRKLFRHFCESSNVFSPLRSKKWWTEPILDTWQAIFYAGGNWYVCLELFRIISRPPCHFCESLCRTHHFNIRQKSKLNFTFHEAKKK